MRTIHSRRSVEEDDGESHEITATTYKSINGAITATLTVSVKDPGVDTEKLLKRIERNAADLARMIESPNQLQMELISLKTGEVQEAAVA